MSLQVLAEYSYTISLPYAATSGVVDTQLYRGLSVAINLNHDTLLTYPLP